MAETFVERYLKRNSGDGWAREAERLLRKEIVAAFGSKRLSDVKKSDVLDVLDGIVDRGASIIANRTLAVFRKFCNWAIERGIIAHSPCDKLRAPAVERSRDRVLSCTEISLAWRAFDRVDWPFGPMAKLLLLTATRRDEVACSCWSEFNLADKIWTIPKARSKNGIAHEVPLSHAVLAILAAIPRTSPSYSRRAGF